jgi:hypothetical protein
LIVSQAEQGAEEAEGDHTHIHTHTKIHTDRYTHTAKPDLAERRKRQRG